MWELQSFPMLVAVSWKTPFSRCLRPLERFAREVKETKGDEGGLPVLSKNVGQSIRKQIAL